MFIFIDGHLIDYFKRFALKSFFCKIKNILYYYNLKINFQGLLQLARQLGLEVVGHLVRERGQLGQVAGGPQAAQVFKIKLSFR